MPIIVPGELCCVLEGFLFHAFYAVNRNEPKRQNPLFCAMLFKRPARAVLTVILHGYS